MEQPPRATVSPKASLVQGVEIHDPYAWLRHRDDPEVFRYLELENAYTRHVMAASTELQRQFYGEMLGRIQETDQSAPVRDDAFWYYSRTEQGKQYRIHCRKRESMDAPEEILLDGNLLAEGHDYLEIGAFSLSRDHRFLAYSADFSGEEKFLLRILDLETGSPLPDEIPDTYYSVEWSANGDYLFYTTLDATLRPFRVWRHRLGSSPSEDVLIFEEADQAFHVDLGITRSERFLVVESASLTTSEVRILNAHTPLGDWNVFLPRKKEIEYTLEHQGGYFWFLINDKGRNFRLVRTPIQNADLEAAPPGERTQPASIPGVSVPSSFADSSRSVANRSIAGAAEWEEILPHRDDVCLEDLDGFAGFLVVSERDNGQERILILDTQGGGRHHVDFDEPVHTVGLASNPMYASETLRLSYQSPTTPPTDIDYEMRSRDRAVVKQKAILGGFQPENYAVERLFAEAPDGIRVPLSVVYRRGTPRDGSAPALLYGYGAYGITTDPGFSSDRLSLLDRGFVYAIAHVRGSGDLGETWHDAGKMLLKKNTFRDFIACAEKLVAEGFTRPERLGILGRSAGGLLMGAVVNERPDLFGAVIASVPFVDVLNTMLDESLPLTVGEFEEWGNPKDPAYFEYIRSYSPYDNICPVQYPHMLVTAGVNDPRVSFWEPAKFVARLRATSTGNNLLLLKTEMGAGHFGPSGRYEQWKETALEYAFLLKTIGAASPVPAAKPSACPSA